MVTEKRKRKSKAAPLPDIDVKELLKPLAELPLESRKSVWQMMDDLENSGNGEGCTRCAVAQVVKNCLTVIGK